MLTPLEQHFLVHHVYVPSAAHWLDGDHHSADGALPRRWGDKKPASVPCPCARRAA